MKLTVCFRDFWFDFDPRNNFILDALSVDFDVEVGEDGEVCFFSVFGREHETFRGLKIQISGEPTMPSWKWSDFSIGFQHLDDDRYLRYPNWCWDIDARLLLQSLGELRGTHDREFCLFLVSNPKQSIRNAMFTELSRHRFVTAPGAVFRNVDPIGERRTDDWHQTKLSVMKDYSFNIAMENSQLAGYTTEKLTDAFLGGSIPLYWGDPLVNVDFDRRAFLNLASFPSIIELVERVLEMDDDPRLIEPMLSVSPLRAHAYEEVARPERFQDFLSGAIQDSRRNPNRSLWNQRSVWGVARRALTLVGAGRLISMASDVQ